MTSRCRRLLQRSGAARTNRNECGSRTHERDERRHSTSRPRWAPAQLVLEDSGQPPSQLSAVSNLEAGLVVVTHRMKGCSSGLTVSGAAKRSGTTARHRLWVRFERRDIPFYRDLNWCQKANEGAFTAFFGRTSTSQPICRHPRSILEGLADLQREPTRRAVCAIMALLHAPHLEPYAADRSRTTRGHRLM